MPSCEQFYDDPVFNRAAACRTTLGLTFFEECIKTKMMKSVGKVYLIGAGPGDPGLITVKGLSCLRRADVVVYDYLANPAFLKEAPAAEKIYVGKTKGCHCRPQEEINELLVQHARSGKTVVRLKGGDPFIFGRGGEEARCLARAKIPFEIVPGVTAALAAAASAGIPLTHRDYTTSLGLVTGHLNGDRDLNHLDWTHLAKGVGTLVIYMGISNLDQISQKLIEAGRSPQTPVAIVRWATFPIQEVLTGTLANIAEQVAVQRFQPPAVIIIGDVVELREHIGQGSCLQPLSGKRILITRSAEQAESFAEGLRECGAVPVVCPTIAIGPPDHYDDLDRSLDVLESFDFLVLTSANGVTAFFTRLDQSGRDARALKGMHIVSVGPKTASELARHGIKADLIPGDYRAEGVVEVLRNQIQGKRILYPKAARAREVIPQLLSDAGAEVVAPVAYASIIPADTQTKLTKALDDGLDLLTFTASSTVQNLVTLLDAESLARARRIPVASIGPLTTKTCQYHGFNVAIEPKEATLESLIDAIVRYYKQEQN